MSMAQSYSQDIAFTSPVFQDEATRIAEAIRNVDDIGGLMHISATLVRSVEEMYKEWGTERAPGIFAYRGDAYRWFFADTLSTDDLAWAQRHLLIISGLYGAVRPLDMISPYRLEMKTKLQVGRQSDLYEFWGDKIASFIDNQSDDIICNLASDEYARVVTKFTRRAVVTPQFVDVKLDGKVGTVPIYSKMMRGVMARWIIDHRANTAEDLQSFSAQGYSFNSEMSRQNTPVFYRTNPKPIRF